MSFKAVAAKIAKRQGEPIENANAELAAATRRASPAARKKNPALNRVKGKAKPPTKRKTPAPAGPSPIANAMGAGY